MGLLSATVAVTRFNVVVPPEGPDFERARFWEIEPGSEVRERMGFVPFELDAPWEVAQGRYVFRLRIDRIRPDATAVKERLRELVKAEMEATGKTFVGPKTRKKLRDLAEARVGHAAGAAHQDRRVLHRRPDPLRARAPPRPISGRSSPCCGRPGSRGTSRPPGSTRRRRPTR